MKTLKELGYSIVTERANYVVLECDRGIEVESLKLTKNTIKKSVRNIAYQYASAELTYEEIGAAHEFVAQYFAPSVEERFAKLGYEKTETADYINFTSYWHEISFSLRYFRTYSVRSIGAIHMSLFVTEELQALINDVLDEEWGKE